MIRIVLAEDQPLILESLKLLLDDDSGIEVVATAGDGRLALEAIRNHRPDIAVLDIRMPVLSGLDVVAMIKEDGPACPVLLLTTFDEPETVQIALNAGVEGFLLKDVEPGMFILAVKAICGGLTVFHPVIRSYFSRSAASAARPLENNYQLTSRDLAVIEAIVQGMSNKEIADRDGCAEGTIKNRVSSILGKMDLNARTQIAVAALKENLI